MSCAEHNGNYTVAYKNLFDWASSKNQNVYQGKSIVKRFHFHTFSFFMSLLMSSVMSLAMLTIKSATLIAVIKNWPEAWAVSMLVAFPVSLAVVPLTQRLVSEIVAVN